MRFARLLTLCVAAALAFPAVAARPVIPRPLRLVDPNVRTFLTIGGEWGRVDDVSRLAFPIELGIALSPDVVFRVEGPFGYVAEPGQAAEPLIGNVGVGVTASRRRRLALKKTLVYGAALTGRIPTSARLSDERRSADIAALRPISMYWSERWSPEAAAIRVDLALHADLDPFTVGLQVGGTTTLPMYSDPATFQIHYGLTAGGRAFRGLWFMVELAGALAAPGRPGQGNSHMVTIAPGLRFETLRFSPAFWLSVPVYGSFDGEAPVVIGAGITSW